MPCDTCETVNEPGRWSSLQCTTGLERSITVLCPKCTTTVETMLSSPTLMALVRHARAVVRDFSC